MEINSEATSEKGEVNIQTSENKNPAFVSGYPFTKENKLKSFLNSVTGYIIAFSLVTALIVIAFLL